MTGMGLDIILENEPEDFNLPQDVERDIYNVIREALTNVTRHSHASKVEIRLIQKNDALHGSLVDNGVGFSRDSVRKGNCFGLSGMEQRVEKSGGEILIESSPGYGTRISFRVPVRTLSESLTETYWRRGSNNCNATLGRIATRP